MKPSEIFAHKDQKERIAKIRSQHESYDLIDEKACKQHSLWLLMAIFRDSLFKRKPLARKVRAIIHALYQSENLYQPSLPIVPNGSDPDSLRLLAYAEQTVQNRDKRREAADEAMQEIFCYLTSFDEGPGLQVPMTDLMPRAAVLRVIELLFGDTFPLLTATLTQNIERTGKKSVLPYDFKGTPTDMARTYLAGTAFGEFMKMTIPFATDDTSRFSHTWVLGSSGVGKTQLLEKLIADDIAREDQPAVIVIDPKGTMLERLQRLRAIGDRLVVLDPAHEPPALNIFAQKIHGRTSGERQQIANNLISLFSYIFDANEASSKLTPRMATAFAYACRLMMVMPGATIQTMLDFFAEDPKKTSYETTRFRPYIERLSPTSRRFFEEQFFTSYGETKKLIADRIFGMMQYPIFEDMFTATECSVDMLDVLQQGKVLLVSSPISLLGKEGSSLFSRLIVAMVTSAAMSRVTVPKDTWRPAFLYIDEAQTVYDETKTQELFQLIREFRVGAVVANQQIKGQLSEALFSTLSSNTGIKYCATRSYDDAYKMAKDMGQCDPSFILGQKIRDRHAHFALYVDGKTPQPLSVAVELGGINKQPMLSWDEFRTHKPPPEDEGLRVVVIKPAEADTHSIPSTHNAATEDAAASRDTMKNPPGDTIPDDDGFVW